MFADSNEVLVSFDPEVLEWYSSVVIPLPQHELFEYLLNELMEELGGITEDEVVRVAGRIQNEESQVWMESMAISEAQVATYATETGRRLTLDVSLPSEQSVVENVRRWLENAEDWGSD
ncbi:hypothetical protein ACFFQF_20955 [Haladaptatus pallidirubidus]|uniref:Uncharacterized protein n=1 Tax=Haladaptatus pallidirubidus TaxID=1008152 RepID=A0AAV3UGI2_9EURY|nr:hypothetical protein [Haladaptatus pallidirubidus]